jgi:hypothetical protein
MLKNAKTYLMISVLAGAVAMTAPVLAADTPTDAQATSKPASPSASDSATASDDSALTTGTVVRPNTREQKLKDCMAIWEPATHMSKEQWKRTCNRQLDDEPRP